MSTILQDYTRILSDLLEGSSISLRPITAATQELAAAAKETLEEAKVRLFYFLSSKVVMIRYRELGSDGEKFVEWGPEIHKGPYVNSCTLWWNIEETRKGNSHNKN